jgi:ElaB/YqjD/DUF883 family membrane-anchored ribosome-binding protein
MDEHRAQDALKEGKEIVSDTAGQVLNALSNLAADAKGKLDQGKAKVEELQATAGDVVQQVKTVAQDFGEQAKSTVANVGDVVHDFARQARDQVGPAADKLYQQGTRAGDALIRNVEQNPLLALLIAGAIGYGLSYLIPSMRSAWLSRTYGTRAARLTP